jgi:DNA-directed RNA polymerase subunit N (RpoN/RPB10)
MVGTRTTFTDEQAPCGRTIGGHQYREEDEHGLIIDVQEFGCGCRASRHEYHDGSFHTQVVRHDKKKRVVDDFGPEHAV